MLRMILSSLMIGLLGTGCDESQGEDARVMNASDTMPSAPNVDGGVPRIVSDMVGQEPLEGLLTSLKSQGVLADVNLESARLSWPSDASLEVNIYEEGEFDLIEVRWRKLQGLTSKVMYSVAKFADSENGPVFALNQSCCSAYFVVEPGVRPGFGIWAYTEEGDVSLPLFNLVD